MTRSSRHLSTTMTGSILTALVLGGLAIPGLARAADEALPTGEAILDNYVEVTGGKAAYAKLHNSVMKGTWELVGMGIKADMTIYAAEPNNTYVLLEGEALGKIEEGISGDVAWAMTVIAGPRIKEGEEKATSLREAAFHGTVQWRKLYKKAECVGMETVNDKPCYKVVLTPHEGKPLTSYYDQESGLLAKTELTLVTPMGEIPVEAYSSDYQRVDGILISRQTIVNVMGQKRMITLKSIEHNVDMPKDRFKLPEDIQALLAKEKSESTEKKNP